MWVLIASLQAVVRDLAPVFTEPSFLSHCQLLLGWVMCLGRHARGWPRASGGAAGRSCRAGSGRSPSGRGWGGAGEARHRVASSVRPPLCGTGGGRASAFCRGPRSPPRTSRRCWPSAGTGGCPSGRAPTRRRSTPWGGRSAAGRSPGLGEGGLTRFLDVADLALAAPRSGRGYARAPASRGSTSTSRASARVASSGSAPRPSRSSAPPAGRPRRAARRRPRQRPRRVAPCRRASHLAAVKALGWDKVLGEGKRKVKGSGRSALAR
jgi:hypothetical protein